MSIENVLSRFEKVQKGSARGSWMALCPAHADKSRSLAISEKDDGKILVHCFAGCSYEEVRAATGLDHGDFFAPEPSRPGRRSSPPPFNARDVLRAVAFEITTVRMIALGMQREGRLSKGSSERLGQAMVRLMSADELINAR